MQNTYREREAEVKDNVSDYAAKVSSAIHQGEDKIRNAVAEAEKRLKQGQKQAKEIISSVDKQLKEKPWPIVAGIAAGCLLLGFILGSSKRNS